jgi:preprotein translocase subunit SecE
MNKLIAYIKESYDELLHKVEWPDRKNLMGSTIATITALGILTVIIMVMDAASNGFVQLIYKL